MKPIVIIDFFWKDENGENIFIENVNKIKSAGLKVLLVTGGKITERMQNSVDYILYNSDNFLFEKYDYEYFQPWNFFTHNQHNDHYSFYFAAQRHGLPVLINIFNSVKYAKSLGFTCFHRILYDTLLGKNCLDFMNKVPEMCSDLNKKSLIYVNRQEHEDLKGEYFFSDIDFFLDNVPCVRSEDDYRKVILDNYGQLKFLIVEKYLYEFLIKKEPNNVWLKNSENFTTDFSDIDLLFQSTTISELNFHPKYSGAPSRITKVINDNSFVLFTTNYSKSVKYRRVISRDINNNTEEIIFESHPDSWCYQLLKNDTVSIDVYEDNKLMYTEYTKDAKNYIKIL